MWLALASASPPLYPLGHHRGCLDTFVLTVCDPPFVLFIYVTESPDLELVILLPSPRCQDYTVHSLWGSGD